MILSTYKERKQLKRAVSPLILLVILLVITLSGCVNKSNNLKPVVFIKSLVDQICVCNDWSCECFESEVIGGGDE